jgi:hypothetical protein
MARRRYHREHDRRELLSRLATTLASGAAGVLITDADQASSTSMRPACSVDLLVPQVSEFDEVREAAPDAVALTRSSRSTDRAFHLLDDHILSRSRAPDPPL